MSIWVCISPRPSMEIHTATTEKKKVLSWNDPHQLLFYLTHILTFYLASYRTYIQTFYLESYRTYIQTFYLASYRTYIQTFYLASYRTYIQTFYLASYRTYIQTFYLASYRTYIQTFYLASYLSYIQSFYLAFFDAIYLTSGARGWGPAVPTKIWNPGSKQDAAVIKSRDLHLASGEQRVKIRWWAAHHHLLYP